MIIPFFKRRVGAKIYILNNVIKERINTINIFKFSKLFCIKS